MKLYRVNKTCRVEKRTLKADTFVSEADVPAGHLKAATRAGLLREATADEVKQVNAEAKAIAEGKAKLAAEQAKK